MRFWLDKGVDGFRVDCVNMYSKGLDYEDAPIFNPKTHEQPGWMIYCNGPRMHEFLREMNDKVLDKYDAVTVGELPHTPDPNQVLKYVGLSDKQLSMVFQFDIVDIGQGLSYKYRFQEWKLPTLKTVVTKWQTFIDGTDGWTTAFCENHDQGRSVSRYASDAPEYRSISAKMLAIMMSAMTGTLFIYQGQEIGMINVPKSWPIEEYKDIESLNFYNSIANSAALSDEEKKEELAYIRNSIQILGRDNARTPMQWDGSPHGGFTTNKAGGWMRTHDLYPEINVAKQEQEADSVLNFWRHMIALRKENSDVFTHGSFVVHEPDNEKTFVFAKKSSAGRHAVVALNFTAEEQTVEILVKGAVFKVGNYADAGEVEKAAGGDTAGRILRPWEGRLYLQE